MAYYHARAGVCRAGVTYAGLAHLPAVFTIGATDRSSDVKVDDFTISTALDNAPSSCQFVCEGFTPAVGNDVTLTLGGGLVWGGTIMSTRAVAQKLNSGAVFWDCQAIDWTWEMDRQAPVDIIIPSSRGVNTIVALLLRTFTDPSSNFRPGYIDSAVGDAGPFTFTGAKVSDALRAVAAAAGCYMRVTPRKSVDLFTDLPASNPLSLSNSSAIRQVVYEQSLAQVRTRTFIVGGGGQTTENVTAGATVVPVDECEWYTGTIAETPGDRFIYSGRSATSGPGNLTGCSDIAYDIPQGTQVRVVARVTDSAAETALATVLGGGTGRSVGWFNAGTASQEAVTGMATNDVALYGAAIPALSYTTEDRFHRAGKQVSVSISDPVTVSGDFRIQSVTMRPYGPVTGNSPTFQYSVQCRLVRRVDQIDLLRRAS